MCTAVTYLTKDCYFGRTLDYECSFGETVTVMPRRFPLRFRCGEDLPCHYAMIGMAHVSQGYPLFYDAVNEHGLCMAGLNFVGNARYLQPDPRQTNVAVFELIPYLLARCKNASQAASVLSSIRITDEAFSDALPCPQLHWLLADREDAWTVECTKDGLQLHHNPVGVLTNNPPFPQQMENLCSYMQLSPYAPENRFWKGLCLQPASRGMGAVGLPGDLSSRSRFVRACFTKHNSISGKTEAESVSQFFHILDTVSQTRGCCRLGSGQYEITRYSACCNATKGIYYYTTYENRQITAVDMHREDLDGYLLYGYRPTKESRIRQQN